MAQRKISKKEAEAILKKYDTKPGIFSFIVGTVFFGLLVLGIAAAYKALIIYLFGG